MMTPDSKKLKAILEDIEKGSNELLRVATDMKQVYVAQARLSMVEAITTQFFTEENHHPKNEPTKLTI